jgi:hypothetical protein
LKKAVDHFSREADYLNNLDNVYNRTPLPDDQDALAQAWNHRRMLGFRMSYATDRAPQDVPAGHPLRKILGRWMVVMGVLWFAYPPGFWVLAGVSAVVTLIMGRLEGMI